MTDLTPPSDEEFIALCPQGEHAPGPEPLSPAAQAVDHAIAARIYLLGEIAPSKQVAAAAIRELMNQVAPHPQGFPTCQYMDGYLKSKKRLRMRSLAIADELEGLGND